MPGAFFGAFNSTIPDIEGQFTETWTFNGADYPAIAIETMEEDQHVVKGGVMLAVHVQIMVRDSIFEQSGVQIGSFISARGVDLAVGEISSDGDASKTLACTPRSLDIWK